MIQKKLRGLYILYSLLGLLYLISQEFLPSLSPQSNLVNSIFLMVLFTFSWLIVHIRIQNDPHRFVGNFMIMTVLQFLAFLGFELVLVLKGALWIQVIHALGVCAVLLVVQTIALAKTSVS